MRFKNQRQDPKMPTIDLIPMLTVMMGVLGFFVVISTLITAPPDRVEVTVPNEEEEQDVTESKRSKPLIVRLQSEEQAEIEGNILDQNAVLSQVTAFIKTNEKAPVVLVSEPQVPYDSVVQWLTSMRQAGGDRVSLGIDQGNGSGNSNSRESSAPEEPASSTAEVVPTTEPTPTDEDDDD